MLAWSSGLSSPRLVVSRSQQSTNPASELAALFQERTVHAADNHRTDFVTDWSHSVQRESSCSAEQRCIVVSRIQCKHR